MCDMGYHDSRQYNPHHLINDSQHDRVLYATAGNRIQRWPMFSVEKDTMFSRNSDSEPPLMHLWKIAKESNDCGWLAKE